MTPECGTCRGCRGGKSRENTEGGKRMQLLAATTSINFRQTFQWEGRKEKERDFRSIAATLNPAAKTRDFSVGLGTAGVSVGVFVERCRVSLLS